MTRSSRQQRSRRSPTCRGRGRWRRPTSSSCCRHVHAIEKVKQGTAVAAATWVHVAEHVAEQHVHMCTFWFEYHHDEKAPMIPGRCAGKITSSGVVISLTRFALHAFCSASAPKRRPPPRLSLWRLWTRARLPRARCMVRLYHAPLHAYDTSSP